MKQNNNLNKNVAKKTIIRQVINLQDNQCFSNNNDQPFISELAKQCNFMFMWLSESNDNSIWEQIWKNQMIQHASNRFPELNQDQIKRLVERDWRIMSQKTKQKIYEKYKIRQNNYQQLEKIIQNTDLEINKLINGESI